jgi:hypothetical protein
MQIHKLGKLSKLSSRTHLEIGALTDSIHSNCHKSFSNGIHLKPQIALRTRSEEDWTL